MLVIRCRYANGDVTFEKFKSETDVEWFVHNEGDHLVYWEYINK